MAFDIICDFYPSISDELLDKALDFASQYIEIKTDERIIMKHTKRPLPIAITCHGEKQGRTSTNNG